MTALDVACPGCSAPFTPGADSCPACGIRLVGPDAARLWQVDRQIADLRREAGVLLESMRSPLPTAPTAAAITSPTTVPSSRLTAGLPVAPASPASPPHVGSQSALRSGGVTGQGLLLGFGALLLLSAVSVFVLVAWSLIGVVGQAVLLTGLTVGAALASRSASVRGLRAAAHTSAVIAIGVSVLMAQGAYSLDVLGVAGLGASRYAAVAALVLAGLWSGYDVLTARVWSPGGPTSAYLPGAVAAVAAGAVSMLVSTEPGRLVLGMGLLVVSALLLVLAAALHVGLDARRRRLPAALGLVLGSTVALVGAVVLVLTAYDLDLGMVERYLAGTALVILAGLLALSPGYAALRLGLSAARAQRWGSDVRLAAGLTAAVGAGTMLLDVPTWAWVGVSASASLALAVAAVRVVSRPVTQAVALLAPGAAALVVVGAETTSASLSALLRGGGGASAVGPVLPVVPVAVEVALPALWALACLARLVLAPRTGHVRAGHAAVGLAVGGTAAVLLAALHGPYQATVPVGLVWVLLALAAARAALVRDRSSDHLVAGLTATYGVVPLVQLLVEGADPVLQAAGAWVLAAGVAWYASAPGRLAAGYLSALLVSSGHVLLVDRWDGAVLEVYTLPSAAAFALLGALQHRATRPHPPSVLTMGPALSIAVAPTLALAVGTGDALRLGSVLVAGIACLVVGVGRGLQAPLLAGASVLAVVALVQGGPYLAYVPAWLLLGCAGAALLVIGVAWERAVGAGRQVGRWVHAMR